MATPKTNVVLLKNDDMSSLDEGGAAMLLLPALGLWDFVCGNKIMLASLGIAGVGLLLLRRWFSGGRVACGGRLDGKLVLITGANSGIGYETAKEAARRGARVVLACRSLERGRDAAALIRRETGSDLVSAEAPLDLASLASVRDFAARFCQCHQRLDVLVNNAGVMACAEARTVDGYEMQLGVNHLGHFLLTNLLLELLRRAGDARIVTVSSRAHEWGSINWQNVNLTGEYTPFKAYSQSKLANVLFTRALAMKLRAGGDDVTATCLHPGAVQTNLGRHQPAYFLAAFRAIGWLALKRPSEGAQTSLHCALAPASFLSNGGYYSDCQLVRPCARAQSDADAMKLWQLSEQMVGMKTIKEAGRDEA